MHLTVISWSYPEPAADSSQTVARIRILAYVLDVLVVMDGRISGEKGSPVSECPIIAEKLCQKSIGTQEMVILM
jgi:hypothetical protein